MASADKYLVVHPIKYSFHWIIIIAKKSSDTKQQQKTSRCLINTPIIDGTIKLHSLFLNMTSHDAHMILTFYFNEG